jgi:cob(I)alamin adenosyltransferase
LAKLEKGLVQVYTGNGKGKTSAAFGLALRAAGRGLKVYVIQFIKGGFDYGELYVADRIPNLTLKAFGRGKFITTRPPEKEDISLAEQALQLAKQVVSNGENDVVILDEVNVAVGLKLVSLEEVMNLIRSRPANVELVLTGRDAPDQVIEAADLVTEMKEVKHPYRKGHASRRGIEY